MPSLPISFKEFNKHPMAAILYLLIVGIVGLFGFLQSSSANEKKVYKEMAKDCATEKYVQSVEMKQLRGEVLELVGWKNRLESKLEVLKELGKIQ